MMLKKFVPTLVKNSHGYIVGMYNYDTSILHNGMMFTHVRNSANKIVFSKEGQLENPHDEIIFKWDGKEIALTIREFLLLVEGTERRVDQILDASSIKIVRERQKEQLLIQIDEMNRQHAIDRLIDERKFDDLKNII